MPAGVPLLLVTGGSSGARTINELVHAALPAIARHWFVVHQTGAAWQPLPGGALAPEVAERYRAAPFVRDGFADLLAAADVVVSRAGANTLGELAATGTPAVLIPLPRTQSRGEQLANARLFAERGAAVTMTEEHASAAKLVEALDELRADPARRAAMARGDGGAGGPRRGAANCGDRGNRGGRGRGAGALMAVIDVVCGIILLAAGIRVAVRRAS